MEARQGRVAPAGKRGILAAAGVCMVLALVGAAAWACTPQAGLRSTPTSGTVGTKITVTGSSFDPAGGPVRVYWGGASGQQMATATVGANRGFTATFDVPNVASGTHIIAATQYTNGQPIAGSPVNMTFRVDGSIPAAVATNVQAEPEQGSVLEPVAEPAVATPVAGAPVAVAAPTPAPAPRVRVAPAQPTTRAPAPAVAAPVIATPAPAAEATPAPAAVASPAPAVTPAAPTDSAPAPARRSVMVSMAADDSGGSSALAIALVGVGLVLALGASAVVLAGRRDRKSPAKARR
jgi:hypothetical protein